MSTKELLINRIDALTEEQSEILYAFFRMFMPNDTVMPEKAYGSTKTEAQEAYDLIAKLRKPITAISSDDDKAEYHKYLEEKYESLG